MAMQGLAMHKSPDTILGAGGAPAGPPEAWLRLLQRIDQEVTALETNRAMWREFHGIAAASELLQEEPDFYFWVREMYGPAQALGVRRMNDGNSKTGSFRRLLESMADNPQGLTAAWFRSDTEGPLATELAAEFADHADPTGLGHLNPQVPKDDLSALDAASQGLKKYVDQHVAHADLNPKPGIPLYADLDHAIDKLFSLLQKYTFLLRRTSRVLGPAAFQTNWQRVFYAPWLSEPQAGGQTHSGPGLFENGSAF